MNRVKHLKRLKTAAKFYKNSFGLHPPYVVLCDPKFIQAALQAKINIEDRIKEAFKGQVYLKITQCGMKEIENNKKNSHKPEYENAANFTKKHCQLFRCNSHQPTTPHDCILDNFKHGFKGILCTQDSLLRRKIARDYPQVPIFFINKGLQIKKPTDNLRNKVRSEIEAKYSTKSTEEIEKPEVKEPFEEENLPEDPSEDGPKDEEDKNKVVIEENVLENK